MLSCREAERMISQRIDAELPTDLDPLLDAHLERCGLCRTLLKGGRESSAQLREAMTVREDVLRDLVASVGPKLRAAEAERSGRRMRMLFDGGIFGIFGGSGRLVLATAASFVFGAAVWFAVFAPHESDAPQDVVQAPVLIVETERDVGPRTVPVVDGPPVEVRQRHNRKVLDEVGPPREGGKLRIELDQYRNDLIRPVSEQWH